MILGLLPLFCTVWNRLGAGSAGGPTGPPSGMRGLEASKETRKEEKTGKKRPFARNPVAVRGGAVVGSSWAIRHCASGVGWGSSTLVDEDPAQASDPGNKLGDGEHEMVFSPVVDVAFWDLRMHYGPGQREAKLDEASDAMPEPAQSGQRRSGGRDQEYEDALKALPEDAVESRWFIQLAMAKIGMRNGKLPEANQDWPSWSRRFPRAKPGPKTFWEKPARLWPNRSTTYLAHAP